MKPLISWVKHGDRFQVVTTLVSLFIVCFILLNYAVLFSILPAQIPLFYSRPWGESQLVSKFHFLLLPGILLLITLINLFISSQLHSSQKVLKRSLLLATVLIGFMIMVSGIKILTIFI